MKHSNFNLLMPIVFLAMAFFFGHSGALAQQSSGTDLGSEIRIRVGGKIELRYFKTILQEELEGGNFKAELMDVPMTSIASTSRTWHQWNGWRKAEINNIVTLGGDEYFSRISISPDDARSAVIVAKRESGDLVEDLLVVDFSSQKIITRQSIPKGRAVQDVCWLNNLNLAILEAESRTGWNPLEIFSAIAGHPVPYQSFFLRSWRISEDFAHGREIPVLTGIKYGWGDMQCKKS